MALFSLFIEFEGCGSFSTQMRGDNAQVAVRMLLESNAIQEWLKDLPNWPQRFIEKDIFLFIPMTNLTNMYLCQLGRDGKYVSIVIARTVSRQIGE